MLSCVSGLAARCCFLHAPPLNDFFLFQSLLSQAIRANKTLTELTLRHNEIEQEGLVAVGKALYKNSTLRELSLWGNAFDDVSCGLFLDLYESRLPYTELSLDCQIYVVDGIHCVAEKSL